MAEHISVPDPDPDRRACPACDGRMSLVRVLPKLGGLPELRTFRCAGCGATETFEENSLSDSGQLTSPNCDRAAAKEVT